MMFQFDATQLIKAYNKGLEDAFMLLSEFDDMENTLNCNGIVTKSDEDNDEV